MYQQNAREIQVLMMTFLGLFHEKFYVKMRHACSPQMPKNQFKIVNVLYHHDGLTATEIGKMLDIEKGSLTTLINQMEAMDLIIRRVDPHDRRKVLLSLSQTGLEQMGKNMNAYCEALTDLFAGVDPEEMDAFVSSLRYVVDFTSKI